MQEKSVLERLSDRCYRWWPALLTSCLISILSMAITGVVEEYLEYNSYIVPLLFIPFIFLILIVGGAVICAGVEALHVGPGQYKKWKIAAVIALLIVQTIVCAGVNWLYVVCYFGGYSFMTLYLGLVQVEIGLSFLIRVRVAIFIAIAVETCLLALCFWTRRDSL